MCFRNFTRIVSFEYQVTSNYRNVSAPAIDVPFEELGRRPGNSNMTVFIYTSATDRASLQKIVNVYKNRYGGLNGFQILFFDDRKSAARNFPMSDAALAANVADYAANKSNGLNKLTLRR